MDRFPFMKPYRIDIFKRPFPEVDHHLSSKTLCQAAKWWLPLGGALVFLVGGQSVLSQNYSTQEALFSPAN